MTRKTQLDEADLTNMARSFGAPAKEKLLEKLRAQAHEREENEPQLEKESELQAFFRNKDERENERER